MNAASNENSRRQKVVFIIKHMPCDDFSSLCVQILHAAELKCSAIDIGKNERFIEESHDDNDNQSSLAKRAASPKTMKPATLITNREDICWMLLSDSCNAYDEAAEMVCTAVLGGSIGGYLECKPVPTRAIVANYSGRLARHILKANQDKSGAGVEAAAIAGLTLRDLICKVDVLSLFPEATKASLDLLLLISTSLTMADKHLFDVLDHAIVALLETLRRQNTVSHGNVHSGQNFDVTDYVPRIDAARLPRASAALREMFMAHVCEDGKKYFKGPPRHRRLN